MVGTACPVPGNEALIMDPDDLKWLYVTLVSCKVWYDRIYYHQLTIRIVIVPRTQRFIKCNNFSFIKFISLNIRYIKQLFIYLNLAMSGLKVTMVGGWGWLQLLRLWRFESLRLDFRALTLITRINTPSTQTLVTLKPALFNFSKTLNKSLYINTNYIANIKWTVSNKHWGLGKAICKLYIWCGIASFLAMTDFINCLIWIKCVAYLAPQLNENIQYL